MINITGRFVHIRTPSFLNVLVPLEVSKMPMNYTPKGRDMSMKKDMNTPKSNDRGRMDNKDKNRGAGHSKDDKGSGKGAAADAPATPPTSTKEEKKFTGRCRLFVGNLTPDTSEDAFKKMFEPYGEISEVYLNAPRGFGFIRLVSMGL